MSSKLAPTPKVAAAVLGGIIASAFLANITLITPDLFEGLGKWSGLVYGLTITFVMGGAGWLKSEEAAVTGGATDVPAKESPVSTSSAFNLAPATKFPAAAVEAASAPAPVIEPVTVAPVFEAPAVVAPVA